MPENTELKEFEHTLDDLGNKVHSYKKTRFIINLSGVIAMFVFILYGEWLYALFMWILFFPDSVSFIRFFKRLYAETKQSS